MQLLEGNGGQIGQVSTLPALTGEEEDLLSLGQFTQKLQRQLQTAVVEGGKSVVQHQRRLFRQA